MLKKPRLTYSQGITGGFRCVDQITSTPAQMTGAGRIIAMAPHSP